MSIIPSEPLAWEVELDRIELDLLRTERLMKTLEGVESVDWSAPALIGPMPEHLLPRARDIVTRQARLLSEILEAMQRTQRQRRFTEVARTEAPAGPVYVDVSA